MEGQILKKDVYLPSGNTPLVLVVDDESEICRTLCDVLQDESLETIVAKNGLDAVSQAKEFKPDLVFLDIWMPGWDGIETLEKVKEVSPTSEVIMISGHATISNALEAAKRGAFDFIEKPLDIESIIQSAKRALEKRQQSLSGNSSQNLEEDQQKIPMLSHPGVVSSGWKGKNLGQRTLARSAILYGQCLHSGQKSGLVLEPLPLNSGIHFEKIGHSKSIPAFIDHVESTSFATTIRSGAFKASTIEHLMSALHAYGISNLLIKCNDEVPIFDGSASEFCKVIDQVGIEEQGGEWFEIDIKEPVSFSQEGAHGKQEEISIEPDECLKISYELIYPDPVGVQNFTYVHKDGAGYCKDIGQARTFGFMKDIEKLQKAGLAAGGRLDNFILIGPDKVVNTELRYEDELVRHKILDILGDLYLIGRPLKGHIKAKMTGHSDNIKILQKVKELAV